MQQNKRSKSIYCAWILIFLSVIILGVGFLLDADYNKNLINPVKDVDKSDEDESTISITTVDGSEVVPGNTITNTNDKTEEEEKDKNKDTDNDLENNSSDNSTANGGANEVVTPAPAPNPAPAPAPSSGASGNGNVTVNIPTIDEANNSLRNSIQNTYGITIKYGSETNGYSVGGFSTTPVVNSTLINAALNRLKNSLSLYPNGFFYEIKNGGIPLTVYLINNYSDRTITGITDSSYSYANISIALIHPFEDSFYHESYHYIERYLFKKGVNFNSWNALNPIDFKYGTVVNSYSYANTFSDMAYFVNNYAQNSDTEDRASTFEYMMADSKASCLNEGRIIYQKAKLIKNTIEAVFNTVNPNVTEYWERFV